jgi:hypothetical protein
MGQASDSKNKPSKRRQASAAAKSLDKHQGRASNDRKKAQHQAAAAADATSHPLDRTAISRSTRNSEARQSGVIARSAPYSQSSERREPYALHSWLEEPLSSAPYTAVETYLWQETPHVEEGGVEDDDERTLEDWSVRYCGLCSDSDRVDDDGRGKWER